MNCLFIFIFVVSSTVCLSQNDTINQTDSNGLRQGYWVKYHENGKKKAEGFFKNNKQIGQFTHYYPTEKIQTVIKHRANSDTSDAVYFHTNGKKMGEGIYVNGKKEGLWLFYDDLEQLSIAEIYHNDLRNGESKTFYLNQKLAKEVIFGNDTAQGPYKEFFENGNIKEEGTFKNGKKHKEVKLFYPNGKIKTSGFYALGKRHDKWIYYDDEGKISAQELYRYGKLQKQSLSEETKKEKEEYQKLLDMKKGDYVPEDSIDE